MFKYFVYKLGQFFLYILPPKLAYHFVMFVSDLHYLFSFRDRKAVKNNLKAILIAEEEKTLAAASEVVPHLRGDGDPRGQLLIQKENLDASTREVFRNFGRYLFEFFQTKDVVDEQFIKKKVKIENLERSHQVLKMGKGGIVVTAHIGNWELGAVILSRLLHPLMIIALPHKERPVNDLFNHQREIKGQMTVIPPNVAVRKCIEALMNNRLIALVADRDFSSHGEILDFLGRKTLIPKGAALFCQKTGAPIIPVFLIREKNNTFTLSIGEPIFSPKIHEGGQDQKTLVWIMKQYTAVLEKKIRQYPTQWLMFRQFWLDDKDIGSEVAVEV